MIALYGFLLSLTAFCVAANSMGAVLYADAALLLDDHGSFLSFNPYWDVALCLLVMLISFLCALRLLKKFRRTGFRLLPNRLAYPFAYLLTLAGLSLLVVLLGLFQLLYPYSPIHLPMAGYSALMALLYLLSGFLLGRKLYSGILPTLLWGAGITVLLLVLACGARLEVAHVYEQLSGIPATVLHGYTSELMDTLPGGLLGRLNLPFSVLLGNYEYAYYDGIHHLSNAALLNLTVLCPPLFFTLGWVAGPLHRRRVAP